MVVCFRQQMVINTPLFKEMTYQKPAETFHQFSDSRYAYGLNFASQLEANSFAASLLSAVEKLNGALFDLSTLFFLVDFVDLVRHNRHCCDWLRILQRFCPRYFSPQFLSRASYIPNVPDLILSVGAVLRQGNEKDSKKKQKEAEKEAKRQEKEAKKRMKEEEKKKKEEEKKAKKEEKEAQKGKSRLSLRRGLTKPLGSDDYDEPTSTSVSGGYSSVTTAQYSPSMISPQSATASSPTSVSSPAAAVEVIVASQPTPSSSGPQATPTTVIEEQKATSPPADASPPAAPAAPAAPAVPAAPAPPGPPAPPPPGPPASSPLAPRLRTSTPKPSGGLDMGSIANAAGGLKKAGAGGGAGSRIGGDPMAELFAKINQRVRFFLYHPWRNELFI